MSFPDVLCDLERALLIQPYGKPPTLKAIRPCRKPSTLFYKSRNSDTVLARCSDHPLLHVVNWVNSWDEASREDYIVWEVMSS